MSHLKSHLPAVILLGGFLVCSTASYGKPEYTKTTKKACVYCHVDSKAKPKELTEAGQVLSRSTRTWTVTRRRSRYAEGGGVESSMMQTVQLAIADGAYAAAVREALSRSCAWHVESVDRPDPSQHCVLVLDEAAFARLPLPLIQSGAGRPDHPQGSPVAGPGLGGRHRFRRVAKRTPSVRFCWRSWRRPCVSPKLTQLATIERYFPQPQRSHLRQYPHKIGLPDPNVAKSNSLGSLPAWTPACTTFHSGKEAVHDGTLISRIRGHCPKPDLGVCTERTADGECGLEKPSGCALFRLFPEVARRSNRSKATISSSTSTPSAGTSVRYCDDQASRRLLRNPPAGAMRAGCVSSADGGCDRRGHRARPSTASVCSARAAGPGLRTANSFVNSTGGEDS